VPQLGQRSLVDFTPHPGQRGGSGSSTRRIFAFAFAAPVAGSVVRRQSGFASEAASGLAAAVAAAAAAGIAAGAGLDAGAAAGGADFVIRPSTAGFAPAIGSPQSRQKS
jgi:hypothetical protein